MAASDKIQKRESIIVPPLEQPQRLSDYCVGKFHTITSRKGVKKAILKHLVFINEKPGQTGDFVQGGETITLYQTMASQHPELDIDLDVLFEDDHLAVINKPPGILVSGNKKWTVQNALENNLKKSTRQDALTRPEPIHRLDYPTTGALLIGKTVSSVTTLNNLFETRKIEKTYTAVCIGEMPKTATISTPINGKQADSSFNVLHTVPSPRFEYLNLVELKLGTGRRHQLRIHLSNIGHQILGDLTYGNPEKLLKGKGLYLHATSLEFLHPFTQENIKIEAPLPKKYGKIFRAKTS